MQEPYPLLTYAPYMTLLAAFHDWYFELPAGARVDEIPDEYLPLVIMAGHESTKGDVAGLAEEIRGKMRPPADEGAMDDGQAVAGEQQRMRGK